MDQRTYRVLEALSKGAALLAAGGLIGGGIEIYTSSREDKRQLVLDSIVNDYKMVCEMQAEAAAVPTGIMGILPAWEQVEKVVRRNGRFAIEVPSKSMPPQELDINNPTASFAELLSSISNRYINAKHRLDGAKMETVPALQCSVRGQVILQLALPLAEAKRREVQEDLGAK